METPAVESSLNHVLQQVPVTQVATPVRASAAIPYYDEQQAASSTVTVNDDDASLDSMTAQGSASTSMLLNMGRIPGPNQLFDKNKKKVVSCPHKDKRYYAKGMCVNCYHRRGRTKKAWKCAHTSKMHYSKGLCKFCYLASYYKNRTGGQPLEDNSDQHNEEQ